jgi:hypothetical protein
MEQSITPYHIYQLRSLTLGVFESKEETVLVMEKQRVRETVKQKGRERQTESSFT